MKKYYIIIFESVIILCSENKEEYDSMMAELKVKYAKEYRSRYEYQQIELLNGKITCYVLVGNKEQKLLPTDIERVNKIWELGVYPFVMPYVDPTDHSKREIPQDIKDFARWCNNRFVFKSCKWEEYKRKKVPNNE